MEIRQRCISLHLFQKLLKVNLWFLYLSCGQPVLKYTFVVRFISNDSAGASPVTVLDELHIKFHGSDCRLRVWGFEFLFWCFLNRNEHDSGGRVCHGLWDCLLDKINLQYFPFQRAGELPSVRRRWRVECDENDIPDMFRLIVNYQPQHSHQPRRPRRFISKINCIAQQNYYGTNPTNKEV